MSDDQRLAVLVTGASTGIGRACALHLDSRGYAVFAGVRREEDATSLVNKASDGLVPVILDVTDEAAVQTACDTVKRAVGDRGLHALVNNAGTAVTGPLEFLPIERIRSQFEVNLLGPIRLVQRFLPLLRQGNGRVVMMSSIAGRVAWPFIGPYCASKHALEALSDAFRMELQGSGVTVTVVEPGNVKTPIWEKSLRAAEKLIEGFPAESEAMYGERIETMKRASGKITRVGISPLQVSRFIERLLRKRRPRARYLLGWDAKLLVFMRTYLPARLADWIILRVLLR